MKKIYLLSCIIACTSARLIAQSCPNGDFETWTSLTYSTPGTVWYTSDPQSLSVADSLTIWSVPGHAGNAIHIETAIVGPDTLMAFITNSLGDPTAGRGGVPYSQQPTALTGYYKYNLPGNDSAIIFVVFKKNSAIVSADLFKIRNAGGSLSTFTAFTLPLSLATIPDSVIIGATSSNLFGSGLQSGSWLELDELAFTGTGITQAIPDGNFDTWVQKSVDAPANWYSPVDFASNGLVKWNNAYSGHLAVEMTTMSNTGGGGGSSVSPAYLTTGKIGSHSQNNGLPYTLTTDTLCGYYQYTPAGNDTGWIFVNLRHNGTGVGGAGKGLTAASSWTYFEMPLAPFSTPDSIRIDIYSSGESATTLGSVLKIDYLQLKSQPLPPAAVNSLIKDNTITVYPNPVADVLNIKFRNSIQSPFTLSIYDMMGRILGRKEFAVSGSGITLPIQYLPSGIYFYELKGRDGMIKDKFIKL